MHDAECGGQPLRAQACVTAEKPMDFPSECVISLQSGRKHVIVPGRAGRYHARNLLNLVQQKTMNDSTHPTQDGSNDRPADASQCSHSQHEHTQTGSCAYDPITRAFRVGCADAKKAAKDAMPVLADALTKAAYN